MDIDDFILTIVDPTIEEFRASKSDLRRAYLGVWAIDSLASHTFVFLKASGKLTHAKDGEFKRELAKTCPNFKIAWDLSTAAKHAVADSQSKSVRASSEITSQKIDGWLAYFANLDSENWGEYVIVHNEHHFAVRVVDVVLAARIELTNFLQSRR